MPRWFERLISSGVDQARSDFDGQRVRLLNIGLVLAVFFSWLSVPVAIVTGGLEILGGNFALLAIAAVVLWLQTNGRAYAAAMTVTLLGFFLLTAQSVYLGSEFGVHFWFLSLILFPALFFPGSSRVAPIVLGALATGAFDVFCFMDLQNEVYAVGHSFTQLFASWLIFGLTVAMRFMSLRVEARWEAQRKLIAETLGKERDLSRLKEEFLASLSHELRTPLNAVLGLSEALLEQAYGPLPEDQEKSVRTINGAGEKLLRMFDDLLDFARIGAGRYPTDLTPVDLRSSIGAVERRLRRVAESEEVRLELDIAEGVDTRVIVDVRHIQRILVSLVDNAIKFTPAGGAVGVRLREAQDVNAVELVVWDTGIGISPERQAHLFQPFVQLEAGLSRRFGGTGLGLALTSRLARLLGADLEVSSEKGKGTTFVLRVQRDLTYRLTVYADLRCPFCFVLNEWLEEANLSHTVRWLGVEQRPGLTSEEVCSHDFQEELDDEVARLRVLAPNIAICKPEMVPNTRRALAALEHIRTTQPWRASHARRELYRAIWIEGIDLTEWEPIRSTLIDFDLSALSDDSAEMHAVVEATAAWRAKGQNRIPMLLSQANSGQWHGLGARGELMSFVEGQVGVRDLESEEGV